VLIVRTRLHRDELGLGTVTSENANHSSVGGAQGSSWTSSTQATFLASRLGRLSGLLESKKTCRSLYPDPPDQLNRAIARVLLALMPFPRIVHPSHPKAADRHAVAYDDETADRIATLGRGIAQDRAEHTLDAVGDVDAALAQRHRGKKLAFEPLVFLTIFVLPRDSRL